LNFHKSILEEDVNITNNSEYYAEYFKTNVVINQTTWERYQLTRISGIKKFNKKFWDDIKATGKYNLSINLPVALAENVNSIMMLVGKNDNIVGFEDQLNILNKQNKVEVAVIEDAGHNICMDQPDYFNFYFNKFLQSIG
jgi:Predicted hydrolases or acyltransferases (alpha/beta hydrolase superfamily)